MPADPKRKWFPGQVTSTGGPSCPHEALQEGRMRFAVLRRRSLTLPSSVTREKHMIDSSFVSSCSFFSPLCHIFSPISFFFFVIFSNTADINRPQNHSFPLTRLKRLTTSSFLLWLVCFTNVLIFIALYLTLFIYNKYGNHLILAPSLSFEWCTCIVWITGRHLVVFKTGISRQTGGKEAKLATSNGFFFVVVSGWRLRKEL